MAYNIFRVLQAKEKRARVVSEMRLDVVKKG